MTPRRRCPTFPAMDVPGKIVGIGQNYRAHIAELGKTVPEEPLLFLKPPSAVIGDGMPIERPGGYARVDHEGELGVVIGRRARRVTREQALEYVGGYTRSVRASSRASIRRTCGS
jgi:2-keto-4-pentenoate hydratase/2-oxohepta-3-ene-1,7-dioic acid hydratase in catechol pathway